LNEEMKICECSSIRRSQWLPSLRNYSKVVNSTTTLRRKQSLDPINNMDKKAENPVNFSLIAIALTARTNDAIRMAQKAGDRDYIQSISEYAIGDLVVNISDVLADEDCLDRVGTILEIREGEVEIRRLDGVTRCVISAIGTYLAAKGVSDVPT
jgi:hypothetical protein